VINNINTFNAAKMKGMILRITNSGKEITTAVFNDTIKSLLAEIQVLEKNHNYLIDILQQQIKILSATIGSGLEVSSDGSLTVGNELEALQALADTAGFLKKVSDGVYSLDASSYQPLNNELSALSALEDTEGFLKKIDDGEYEIDTTTYCSENNAIAYAIALG